MPLLTPPTFVDGVAATAANLNLALDELELINGGLSTLNHKSGEVFTKRIIRQGALTRHASVAASAGQHFVVTDSPSDRTDVTTGTHIYPAGGIVEFELPPGKWQVKINYDIRDNTEDVTSLTTNLVYRNNNASWQVIANTDDFYTGVFMHEIADNALWRHTTYAIRVSTPAADEFEISAAKISIVAYRTT